MTLYLKIIFLGLAVIASEFWASDPAQAANTQNIIRFATYNVSMFRRTSGQLLNDLKGGKDDQAKGIAEVIQRVRPDVLLLNEFDYDEAGLALQAFCTEYLQVGQKGHSPILYPYIFLAPVNTGVPSHRDLDHNGQQGQPNDAYGFGRFPGQYGMVILSRFPIQQEYVRTFQNFLWKDMPQALLPEDPETGRPFFNAEDLKIVRLSSKSHWDVPVVIGNRIIHVLAAHPTPPIYDGPEKRNARRNHDEIRLWADYIHPARSGYIYDDRSQKGGLPAGSQFIIMGDYNSDPFDGDTFNNAIEQLLKHPFINADIIPESEGAVESAMLHIDQNRDHRGDSRFDTANFSSGQGPGNLRVDYVLPSRTLEACNAGVFWPASRKDAARLVEVSDHRLVWVEIKLGP